MKVITVDQIMSLELCDEWPRQRVEALLAPYAGAIPVERVRELDLLLEDLRWALAWLLPTPAQRLFACWCCRRMPLLTKNSNLTRAVDVAETYAHNEATIESLVNEHRKLRAASFFARQNHHHGRLSSEFYWTFRSVYQVTKPDQTLGTVFAAFYAALAIGESTAQRFEAQRAETEAQVDELVRRLTAVEVTT